jgi:hypothetical protein
LLPASSWPCHPLADAETYEFRQKVTGLAFNPVWEEHDPKLGEWEDAGASADCTAWMPEVWTVDMGQAFTQISVCKQ